MPLPNMTPAALRTNRMLTYHVPQPKIPKAAPIGAPMTCVKRGE